MKEPQQVRPISSNARSLMEANATPSSIARNIRDTSLSNVVLGSAVVPTAIAQISFNPQEASAGWTLAYSPNNISGAELVGAALGLFQVETRLRGSVQGSPSTCH